MRTPKNEVLKTRNVLPKTEMPKTKGNGRSAVYEVAKREKTVDGVPKSRIHSRQSDKPKDRSVKDERRFAEQRNAEDEGRNAESNGHSADNRTVERLKTVNGVRGSKF